MKISFTEKYLCFAFTYSGIRKLFYTYNTKYTQKIDNKIEERPILYTHHFIHFLFAAVMGVGLTPVHLANDIERLEMYFRNIKSFPNKKYHTDTDFYTVLLDEHRVQ
jgi:hypothetical protein